jgi:hypothetical protein
MTSADHNKILAIGFAAFAAILFFTFLLLALVSVGVFVALGLTFANESGNPSQAGVGILGAIFTVIFYGGLALICVLPPAMASWKMLKRRPGARIWGIIAAIVLLAILPLGTMFGVYGLWFFLGAQGRNYSWV